MQKNSSGETVRTTASARRPSQLFELTRVLLGFLFTTVLLQPIPTFSAPPADPYSLRLAWDASSSPEVDGYVIYYGAASGNYTSSIDVGNVTTVTIPDLSSGVTYYFALTAVNIFGEESGYSNEISYGQGLAGLEIQAVGDGQFQLTVTGLAGHNYDIEATQDFQDWTVIGNVTSEADGPLNFTDPNAANFPQRFYRTRDLQP